MCRVYGLGLGVHGSRVLVEMFPLILTVLNGIIIGGTVITIKNF